MKDARASRTGCTEASPHDARSALYEKTGFTSREGGPEGPVMLYYERDV